MSTRLQLEWQRLYQAAPATDAATDVATNVPTGSEQVRGMLMTLGKPADWLALSALWQGVQLDLSWPAPAIAVSGADGYQLWFSLAQAVPAQEVHAVLDALRQRYMGHIVPERVGIMPAHASAMPGEQVMPDQWSAFVASDLAPMFADTPWLDIPPSPDGQADLLSGLNSIKPAAWQAALAQARPPMQQAGAAAQVSQPGMPVQAPCADPRRFLQSVMNDERVALALRIEAAKALLSSNG
jgi:hypothetical protein